MIGVAQVTDEVGKKKLPMNTVNSLLLFLIKINSRKLETSLLWTIVLQGCPQYRSFTVVSCFKKGQRRHSVENHVA